MRGKRFISHTRENMNITVEVNYTDSIFHIKEDNGQITHNQIFFDLEDAKEIKKILSELIIKKEKGEI
jgi:hypothetical protein